MEPGDEGDQMRNSLSRIFFPLPGVKSRQGRMEEGRGRGGIGQWSLVVSGKKKNKKKKQDWSLHTRAAVDYLTFGDTNEQGWWDCIVTGQQQGW